MGNYIGGGRGGQHVRGNVYVMRLPPNIIKIGCTERAPQVRLQELKRQYDIPKLRLLASFFVHDMGDGEDLAQNAAIQAHRLQNMDGHDDWFIVPRGVTLQEIVATVTDALQPLMV